MTFKLTPPKKKKKEENLTRIFTKKIQKRYTCTNNPKIEKQKKLTPNKIGKKKTNECKKKQKKINETTNK